MNITFTTDKSKIDINAVADFLHTHSYWAKNRPVETIKKSIKNSHCVAAFIDDQQIGFARIVSDFTTMYYLGDIYIIPEHQNKGFGHKLMSFIMEMEELQGLRGILTTRTAHKFYEEFGFSRDNDIVRTRIMISP